MNPTMDLRISADADIKRLREMVQKLEEKNAAIKTPESPRQSRVASSPVSKYKNDKMSSSPVLERVAVRLHLDDVPLMNLSDVDSEEDDAWLYTSPIHPPTPAQKSVSPFKYLKHSIEHQNDLNKVRGSLMAKLESIAAQEELLSRHDLNDSPHKEPSSMNRTFTVDNQSKNSNHYDDDLEPLNISGSDTYPIRRRGTPSRPPQTKLYKPWENLNLCDDDDDNDDNDYDDPPLEAPVINRRGTFTKPVRRGQSPRSYDDTDGGGVVKPRGRSSQSSAPGSDDDDDFDNAPVVRRRGAKTAAAPAVMPSNDIPIVNKVRPRGQATQSLAVSVPSDDEDDMEIEAPVIRRRGAGPSGPVARSSVASPQQAWQGDDDDDMGPVRPRRRGTPKNDENDDGDFDAPVVRRRGPPSPRPVDDSLVVTAVRRRGAQPADGQIRPRGSGLPTPSQGGIPTPSKRSTQTSRLKMSADSDIKRRSLPQVPSDSMIHPRVSGTSTPPRVRAASPASGVVPRGSKLAAPRRIPTPRASNSYYAPESDQNWQDGCY